MGDFNLPNVDFGSFSVQGSTDSFASKVYDCVLDNYWTQHVNEHTHFRANQVPSGLDWVIMDDPNILEELQYDVPLGKSDHVCLKWQISLMKRHVVNEMKYNYWKADYAAIRTKLSTINWLLWARQSHALVESERGPTLGNPRCKAEFRYATLRARGR